MRRSPILFTIASVVLVAALGRGLSVAADEPAPARPSSQPAPPPSGPPPMRNLQIFPKDTPRSEVIQTMRQFCFSLGVRCEHCHADEQPDGSRDFSSDEKPAKEKARAMIRMTNRINQELLATIPNRSDPPVNVGCFTCHHGLPHPETLAERLHETGSADSAVAELRQLRETAEFGRFDVSEWGVTEAARNLAAEGSAEAALAVLTENAAIHPESMAIPTTMAEIHAANGDTASAVQILEQIIAKDPENRHVKQMLQRLSGAE